MENTIDVIANLSNLLITITTRPDITVTPHEIGVRIDQAEQAIRELDTTAKAVAFLVDYIMNSPAPCLPPLQVIGACARAGIWSDNHVDHTPPQPHLF